MTADIDFFFTYGSTYSYLSVMRAGALAAAAGASLRWRPFYARKLMEEQNNRPFLGKPVKTRYMWRDIERRAARLGIPFNGIPPYPISSSTLPHRAGIVAEREGWCPEFSIALYRAWFLEHKEPGKDEHVAAAVTAVGRDAKRVLAQADTAEVEGVLTANTDEARELGMFGSPTFVVGKEIFWGDDRLEEAIDWFRKGT